MANIYVSLTMCWLSTLLRLLTFYELYEADTITNEKNEV